jgi:outer membrane protein OmpA-like peptidoglycan-associated protein
MKRSGLLAFALLLGGCGFRVGLVNAPPAPGYAETPSRITVHRANRIIGFVIPMTFLIDSVEIYGLWSGGRYDFSLAPGEYVFGYFLGVNECRQRVQIEPGRNYRVTLAPSCVIEARAVGGPGGIIGSYTIDLVEDEFAFDSAELKPAMRRALDDLARRVRASPGDERLTIVGHTDSAGSREYNDRLGQRRADASKQYLVAIAGLDPSRIRTSSAGAGRPVATNDTATGRARNRRIEIRAERHTPGA